MSLTAAVLLATLPFPASGGGETVGAARTDPSMAVLEAHNIERASIGLSAMRWDPSLAAGAADYARTMAVTGRWGHSAHEDRPGQGENLWMGTRAAFHPTEMVDAWIAEKRDVRPGVFPNVSSTGSWQDVGHYTQMVWPETERMGCAIRSSLQADYLVCRYAAPGNVMGTRISFAGARPAQAGA